MNFFKKGSLPVKVDLHLHTISDPCFKYDQGSEGDFAENFVNKIKDNGIRVGESIQQR